MRYFVIKLGRKGGIVMQKVELVTDSDYAPLGRTQIQRQDRTIP